MAVVRYRTGSRDIKRFERDRARHRAKVREAIKEGLGELLEGVDIISISPFQKIKIPLRNLKEFQFAFAEKNPGVAQAPGAKKGDKLGKKEAEERMPGPQAGDMPGEDVYEVEMYAYEIQELIDEKYNLPHLEEKEKSKVPEEEKTKIRGYKRRGPLSRLARRRTVRRRIERGKKEAWADKAAKKEQKKK